MHLLQQGYDGPLVNIGCGQDVTIRELAKTVMKVVGGGHQGRGCTATFAGSGLRSAQLTVCRILRSTHERHPSVSS